MPAQASPRDRLLADVLAFAAEHGIAGASLREVAAAIGSSHRMLIHHFGSKEGLLVAVVQAMEAQQREALVAFRSEGAGAWEAGDRLWAQLLDPGLAPFERLFFEVYGQALQGRAWAEPLLAGVVDDWVAPLADLLVAEGADAGTARTDARLALAVTRGLLLDLLATGDRAEIEAAMARFRAIHPGPSSAPPAPARHPGAGRRES